jgi:hypothetical protein
MPPKLELVNPKNMDLIEPTYTENGRELLAPIQAKSGTSRFKY